MPKKARDNLDYMAFDIIKTELKTYGLENASSSLIREKEGVIVARVTTESGSRVLKAFEDGASLREIENYRVLASLGVPTLRLFGSTSRSLLMEDIEASPDIRLGLKEDLCDPEVIKALARWYRALHEKGAEYVREHGAGMYDEWDLFTLENIGLIGRSLGAECTRAVTRLKERFPEIKARIDAAPKTLCYNDFYYTNMAVNKDKSAALMFDYNLLGKGCPANDVSNAAYWFSEENKALFIKEYGGIDASLFELSALVSPAVSLISALKRGIFPDWAEKAAAELVSVFGA